ELLLDAVTLDEGSQAEPHDGEDALDRHGQTSRRRTSALIAAASRSQLPVSMCSCRRPFMSRGSTSARREGPAGVPWTRPAGFLISRQLGNRYENRSSPLGKQEGRRRRCRPAAVASFDEKPWQPDAESPNALAIGRLPI